MARCSSVGCWRQMRACVACHVYVLADLDKRCVLRRLHVSHLGCFQPLLSVSFSSLQGIVLGCPSAYRLAFRRFTDSSVDRSVWVSHCGMRFLLLCVVFRWVWSWLAGGLHFVGYCCWTEFDDFASFVRKMEWNRNRKEVQLSLPALSCISGMLCMIEIQIYRNNRAWKRVLEIQIEIRGQW
jgi:hypothetical protein